LAQSEEKMNCLQNALVIIYLSWSSHRLAPANRLDTRWNNGGATKIADTLEVSLDYLAGDSEKASFDKQTLKLIDEIGELEHSIKDKLLFLANAIILDAKTGKAYAH